MQNNDHLYLPQRGFGDVYDFASLIKSHKVLFRIYTPRANHQAAVKDDDLFFIAGDSDPLSPSTSAGPSSKAPSYADVIRHLDWSTRGTDSPFITASFSFSWSLWEAYRRYYQGVKRDVQIAVIDAEQVSACTPTEVLAQCPEEQRHDSHWKWYNAVQDSQSVLIYESVRKGAVLASVPLRPLLDALPTYFNTEAADMYENWLESSKKPSYSTFCREMTTRFLAQNNSTRLHASTAHALRTSWAFLQPWFTRGPDDRQGMSSKLASLASQVAHWPAPVWSIQHPEINRIIWDTSSLLVDYLVDHRKDQDASYVDLEQAVKDLERILGGYQEELERRVEGPSNETEYEPEATDGSDSENSDSLPNTPSTIYDPLPPVSKGDMLSEEEGGLSLLELTADEPLAGPATTHLDLSFIDQADQSDSLLLSSTTSTLTSEKETRSIRPPTAMEQVSVAGFFFLVSALATLFVARGAGPQPLLRNIT